MKKTLLLLGFLVGLIGNAQDCSELFISEYLEGLSNNKALEIYNPTSQTIDLSNYFVVRYDNGSSNPTVLNAVQLRGTLASNAVHVGVLDKRDPNGEGQEAPIWDDLVAKADEWYCPVYDESKAFYWNGNDAVVLFKGKIPEGTPLAMPVASLDNVQPIDIFGKIGEDPGNPNDGGGWTYDGTPLSSGGVVVSANHFLVRKPFVKKGVTTNPDNFKPMEQWDSLSFFVFVYDENGEPVLNNQGEHARRMNVDNLGIHDCECSDLLGVTAHEYKNIDFRVFPNPVTENQVNFLSTNDDIEEIIITNSFGQVVKTISHVKGVMVIDLNVESGIYFITARSKENFQSTRRIVVQ